MSLRKIIYWLSLVFIFMLPWEGVIQLPGGVGTAAKFVGLTVGALWLVDVVVTGRLRKPDAFLGATCIFVAWNALSVLWSAAPGQSIGQVATFAQCLGFVYVLWDLYRTRAAVLTGLQAYVLGVYVAVGSAAANYFSANPFYTHYERFSPGLTHPDGFGFMVAMGIPIAWYLAGPAGTSKLSLTRVVNYAFIPTAFVGIAFSGTRSAAIAAVPGMAFGLASLTRLRLSARIAVFVLLTAALFFLLPVVEPLKSFQRMGTIRAEATEGDLNGRTNQWSEGLDAFGEHPALGVGANMYRSVNSLGHVAHNSFLSVLVQLGLIGFVLFGIILIIVVIYAFLQPRWDRNFWLTLLSVWAIGAFTLTWEDRKTTWLFLGLVVASATFQSERARAPRIQQRDRPSNEVLGVG
jgi:O-antigen ligase